eukprot:376886-Prorocentrum_lima.AAC.1
MWRGKTPEGAAGAQPPVRWWRPAKIVGGGARRTVSLQKRRQRTRRRPDLERSQGWSPLALHLIVIHL